MRVLSRVAIAAALFSVSAAGFAQNTAPDSSKVPAKGSSAPAKGTSAPDESALGEFVVTGTVQEHIPKIAILPSLSAALEDVIVRSVIRRDFEISGLFDVIADEKAPRGRYGFNDPVDLKVWQSLGAEAVVKVAARDVDEDHIEVFGLAYFPSAGDEPVYELKKTVKKTDARRTAHRITDGLLGALTGRPGGFSSRFTYSGAWGRNRRIFTVDSDGFGLNPETDKTLTALSPAFGPDGDLYFSRSKNYSPFRLHRLVSETASEKIDLPFKRSVYSTAFNKDRTKLAVAVAEPDGSAIYVGNPDGTEMKKVSTTQLATHPAFSPSGKLAWVGGGPSQGAQRIYLDGKAVSPSGFSASAPTFCDTEDGIFLVYAVAVGNDRQDLVMSAEAGRGLQRLTQNQGSNSYPACSPDGRLLAFFSTRKTGDGPGLHMLSLKRWTTERVLGSLGESLRWDPLPEGERAPTKPAPAKPAPAKPAPAKPDTTPVKPAPAPAKSAPAPAKK